MSKKPPATFAQALVQARTHLGLTKEALGRRLGLTAKSVARWEQGHFMPAEAERPRLVGALAGVPESIDSVLRDTLGVPKPRVTADATAYFALDSAVLAMAERLPSAPVAELRGALVAVLERLASAELDVPRALSLARAPRD